MTLSLYTSIQDTSYYVEAEVTLVGDNLGVPHSNFVEPRLDHVMVWMDDTGEQVDLEANRAFKKDIMDLVMDELRNGYYAWG